MDELKRAVDDLLELQGERKAIRSFLEEAHPQETERLSVLEREIATTAEKVKVLIRDTKSTQTVLGHTFKVAVPKKTTVHIGGLLERAKERGEMHTLLEYEVLTYDVRPEQIERLPGVLRAVYSGFIEMVEETPRVTFPAELK